MFSRFPEEKLLYRRGPMRVFRSIRDAVVVKALDNVDSDRRRTLQLRREYEIGRSLRPGSGTPRFVELLEEGPAIALVMEDIGGWDLAKHPAQTNGKLTLDTALMLSEKLAHVVGSLHEQSVVHQNITPSNIIWNAQSGELQVIDLGIASRLTRERQSVALQGKLDASLPYMSPEQTGRMNLDLDYRSDLYSVGITMYRMLTGVLPFDAPDFLGWIYTHLAVPAPDPCEIEPTIPKALGAVVLKLLEKDPAARYQSAAGLIADLQKIRHGQFDFVPGTLDVRSIFSLPQKVYGRSAQLTQLKHSLQTAARGQTALVLVTGPSGIGKSSVVGELHRSVPIDSVWIGASKFEQFQRKVPHAAILAACAGLAEQLLSLPENLYQEIRDAMRRALAEEAAVLVDLVPELGDLLGPAPPMPALGPVEARVRLERALHRFLGFLARPKRPVVLFIDELQWADTATLDFIATTVSGQMIPHLLLVGAYRDDEVSDGHPVSQALSSVPTGCPISRIAVGPLQAPDVAELIADTIARDDDETRELAKLVVRNTNGNPFFVSQLLTEEFRAGHISFSSSNRRWNIDLSAIGERLVASNVVDLLTEALKGFEEQTTKLLQFAACYGSRFDLQTLSAITGASASACQETLWPAVSRGVLAPLSEAYKYLDADVESGQAVAFRFQHDRVQEAALEPLTKDDRAWLHLRIGKVLFARCPTDALREQSIAIVSHWNSASQWITTPQDRRTWLELNWEAAQRAKESGAHLVALEHIERVVGLFPESAWETEYELRREVEADRMQALSVAGKHDAAIASSEVLLAHGRNAVDRAQTLSSLASLSTFSGDFDRVFDQGLQGLADLGIVIPKHPKEEQVFSELTALIAELEARDLDALINQPMSGDKTVLETCRLCRALGIPAYQASNMLLFVLLQVRGLRLSLERGFTPIAPSLLAATGMVLVAKLHHFELATTLGKTALALEEKMWMSPTAADTCFICALFIFHWRATIRQTESLLRRARDAAVMTGQAESIAQTHTAILPAVSYARGISAARAQLVGGYDAVRITKSSAHVLGVRSFAALWASLQGETDPIAPDFDVIEQQSVELHAKGMVTAAAIVATNCLRAHFYAGRYLKAFGLLHLIERNAIAGSPQEPDTGIFIALACAAAHPFLDDQGRRVAEAELSRCLEGLTEPARFCPENFAPSYNLVAAERARILGDHEKADAMYDLAVVASQARRPLEVSALAYECAARHYAARGRTGVAGVFARRSIERWMQWDAHGRAAQLQREFRDQLAASRLLFSDVIGEPTGHDETPSPANTTASWADIDTVLKASRALAREVKLDRLLLRMLPLVIENTGAERVVLAVREEGTAAWFVDAKQTAGSPVVLLHCPIAEEPVAASALFEKVIRTGQEIVVDNVKSDERMSSHTEHREIQALMCVPIQRQGELSAALQLETTNRQGFSPDRTRLLRVLLGQMAIALRNAQLYDTLERRVEERTSQLQGKSDEIRSILETIHQGIFTFGENGTIHPEYSRHLEEIFERRDLAGASALSLLFEDSDISKAQRHQVDGALQVLIGCPSMQFWVNEHVLLHEFTKFLGDGTREKRLELSWSPIVEDNVIVRVMVVVRDVTELRKLQTEAKNREHDLELLLRLLGQPARQVRVFLREARQLVDKNERLLANESGDPQTATIMRRNYHTLKGSARFVELTDIADLGYEGQTVLTEFEKSDAPLDINYLQSLGARTRRALEAYERVYAERLAPIAQLGEHSEGWATLVDELRGQLPNLDRNDPAAMTAFHDELSAKLARLDEADAA